MNENKPVYVSIGTLIGHFEFYDYSPMLNQRLEKFFLALNCNERFVRLNDFFSPHDTTLDAYVKASSVQSVCIFDESDPSKKQKEILLENG